MNIQKILEVNSKEMRQASLRNSKQINLGTLIKELESIDPFYEHDGKQEEKKVEFDFPGNFTPSYIDSWRGSYCELALDYEQGEPIKIKAFIEMLKEAVGKTYAGYKGGDYLMSENTPVWVDHYGDSGHTGIIGVEGDGWRIYILTKKVEF